MCRLLLRLNCFHPGLCNEFAGRLLTVLEPLFIEFPHIGRLSNLDTFPRRGDGYRDVVVIVYGMASSGSFPVLSGWHVPVVEVGDSSPIHHPVSGEIH